MNKTKEAFRLIVIRRLYQRSIFFEQDSSAKFTVIATNRTESAQEIVSWYNQRGDHSENRIKELNIGFGIEKVCPVGNVRPMPSSLELVSWPILFLGYFF